MKKRKTKTHMIIDCSSSMSSQVHAVSSGVAEYAQQMKEGDWLSLTEFRAGTITQVIDKASKKDMASKPYRHKVGGMTNLYDAVGKVLSDALLKKSMKGRVVVITTDGYENASKEITLADVKHLIKQFTKKGGVVQYMSSSADPFGDAQKMGIDASATMSFSAEKTRDTFSVASASIARGAETGDYGYTDEERKKLA